VRGAYEQAIVPLVSALVATMPKGCLVDRIFVGKDCGAKRRHENGDELHVGSGVRFG
jgi:hypothetical protein